MLLTFSLKRRLLLHRANITMDSDDTSSWECIAFTDLTVCETIGGGGVALVHRGIYRNNAVALKSLVRGVCRHPSEC